MKQNRNKNVVTRLCKLAVGAVLAFGVSDVVRAADWPQWRGPDRNGQSKETGLLKEWPAGGPPLAFKATGIGEGYATVTAVGDRIYTMGDKGGRCNVFCLDAKDGKIIWTAGAGREGEYGGFKGPRATPTIDGQFLYVNNQHGDVTCLTLKGDLKWTVSLTKDFGGDTPGWGYAQSPFIDGNNVILTPGGRGGVVLALDKATGRKVWQSQGWSDNAHYSSVVKAEIGGVPQYLQLTDKSVAGIAAKDGSILWKADRRGKTAVIPDPIYKDGMVFVTSGYGVGCNMFQVTGNGNRFNVKEAYANRDLDVHHGGLIQLGDYVFGSGDSKKFTCMEIATGKVKWSDRTPGKGSVMFADGHFYFRDERGPITLIEASTDGYKQKGRFDQPDRSRQNAWPHPVIANGRLYIRDQDILLVYDVKAK